MNNAQKTRLKMVMIGVVIAGIALYLTATGLNEQASLFQSPTDIKKLTVAEKKTKNIRIGGLVLEKSLKTMSDGTIEFQITDYQNEITVHYRGLLPDLFREGQGVYADGQFDDVSKIFVAREILAKHDEKYTPPMPGEGL